ncbi:MAG TPA: aromatic ring-hydroxylating dioxygenase subunit alpha [Vicinamibacteria bacterium]
MTSTDLEAVLRPFAQAVPLPRDAFVDPEVLELEQRVIFDHAWVPVAHEADLQRPGDWARAPLRGEHLVVLRGADLELAALHAVCAHRGTLLCEGDAGRIAGLELRCPYHGWTYATDGTLLSSPGRPPSAPAVGLPRARVAVHAGVVFVNLDLGAPGLEASWEGGPPWLRRAALMSLERVSRSDHEVAANWKVLVGNFQESHHFPAVHPGLEARTPWRRSSSVVESQAWLGGLMELAEGCETVSQSGQRRGRPFVAGPEDRGRVHDALVFPLWLTSLQPDYLLTYRLAPLAVDRTLVVAEIHVHPGARAAGVDLDDVFAFWQRTNAEDRAICERQQRGLASRRARPSGYAASEDGLHAFERLLAARYLRGMRGEAGA